MKKQICVLLLTLTLSFAWAQKSSKEILHQKTEAQLADILAESSALTGLMAVDLTSGEKFAWNPDVAFTQASAIKIPILMEVYKQAHEKRFSLTDIRKIEDKNFTGGSGVLNKFTAPVSLSIRNIAILMIVLSDNTATNTLIDLVGLPAINATLKSLGLKDTRLQRKMMDQAASGRGDENISTPAEAAKLLQMLFKGEFIDKATSSEIISILKKNERENSRLAAGIPENVPVAFKPGELNGVSTEWAIVLLKERPYAVTVMENYKLMGKEDRTMEKISAVLYQYFWRLGNATRYGAYVDPVLIK